MTVMRDPPELGEWRAFIGGFASVLALLFLGLFSAAAGYLELVAQEPVQTTSDRVAVGVAVAVLVWGVIEIGLWERRRARFRRAPSYTYTAVRTGLEVKYLKALLDLVDEQGPEHGRWARVLRDELDEVHPGRTETPAFEATEHGVRAIAVDWV